MSGTITKLDNLNLSDDNDDLDDIDIVVSPSTPITNADSLTILREMKAMTSGVITATVSASIDLVKETVGTGLTTDKDDRITMTVSGIGQ